jgi:hypothetical protein
MLVQTTDKRLFHIKLFSEVYNPDRQSEIEQKEKDHNEHITSKEEKLKLSKKTLKERKITQA